MSSKGIRLIAFFKLLKGALFLAAGVGALTLLNKDVESMVRHWIALLHVDPDNRYIHQTLLKIGKVNTRQLEQISAGTLFYALLALTEGIGLLKEMRWAEYLTVSATALFVPLEVYEIFVHPRVARIVLLVVNVAIVWYLAACLNAARSKKVMPET